LGAGGCEARRQSGEWRAGMKNGAARPGLMRAAVFYLCSTATSKGLSAESGVHVWWFVPVACYTAWRSSVSVMPSHAGFASIRVSIPAAGSRRNRRRVNFRNAIRSSAVWGVCRVCIPAARQSQRRFSDSRSQKYWLSVYCLARTRNVRLVHHHPLFCCFRIYRCYRAT
jgi:hypothetical protein